MSENNKPICPFCKGEMIYEYTYVDPFLDERGHILCDCGYREPEAKNKYAALSAHNKVFKDLKSNS